MTPEEAKEKWCPFARVAVTETHGTPAFNRVTDRDAKKPGPSVGSFCIADRCMAWRWGYDQNGTLNETHGYCGLAGEP